MSTNTEPTDDATSWVDKQGDVWTLGDDGLLHSPETAPFPREHVEKKWGPLTPVHDVAAGEHHAHAPGHIEGDHVVTVQVSCELLAELSEWSRPVQAQIQHHSGHEPEYTMEFRTHNCPSEHHTGNLNLAGQGNPDCDCHALPGRDHHPLCRTQETAQAVAAHMSSVAGIYYVPQTSDDPIYDQLARAALEVAYPAIRQHVAEQIAQAHERAEDDARRAEQIDGAAGRKDAAKTWHDLAAGYMRSAERAREFGGGQ